MQAIIAIFVAADDTWTNCYEDYSDATHLLWNAKGELRAIMLHHDDIRIHSENGELTHYYNVKLYHQNGTLELLNHKAASTIPRLAFGFDPPLHMDGRFATFEIEEIFGPLSQRSFCEATARMQPQRPRRMLFVRNERIRKQEELENAVSRICIQ